MCAGLLVSGLPGLPGTAPALAAKDRGPSSPAGPTEQHTPYSHAVLGEDGIWRAQVFDVPMFSNDQGGWRQTDNALSDNPDEQTDPDTDKVAKKAYRETTFGKNGKKLVTFKINRQKVRLSTQELKVNKPVADADSGLDYSDVARDTSLRVSPSGAGVRTEFRLASSKAPTSFRFRLSDPGGVLGTPSKLDNGGWQFSGEIESGVRFGFEPAYAYELDTEHPEYAPGAEPGSGHLEITAAGRGEWDIVKSVDPKWLKGKRFPIVLDPAMSFGRPTGYTTRDCHMVNGNGSNYNYCTASGVTEVGWGTGSNVTGDVVRRQVTQTDFVGAIPGNATIDRAVLSLFLRRNFQNTSFPISAYRTGQYWSNAATWYNYDGVHAWTTQSANPVGGEISRLTVGRDCVQGGRCEWPITDVVRNWKNGSYPQDGISLLMSSERSVRAVMAFSSSENEFSTQWPYYQVEYRQPPSQAYNVAATEEDGASTVTWDGAYDYGTPITNYYVAAFPAGSPYAEQGAFCDGSCRSLRLTGLTNGRSYTFKVYPYNSAGYGPSGDTPNGRTYTPFGRPFPPYNVSADADPAASSLRVAWSLPGDNGRAITSYTIRATNPGGPDRTISCTTSPCDVGGLTNTRNYTVTVAAVNARGESDQSPAASAVPYDRPDTPPDLTASTTDRTVRVTWGNTVDNGRPVLDFTAYLVGPGGAFTVRTLPASARSVTFQAAGLDDDLGNDAAVVNGQSYTVYLNARNIRGTSNGYAVSGPVIPAGKPGTPTGVQATASVGTVKAEWLRPDDNGSPLTRYDLELRDADDNSLVKTVQVTSNLTANAQSYTFTGLTDGQNLYVKVRAANAVGEGEFARSDGAVQPLQPLILEKTSDRTGKAVGPGDVVTYTLKITNPNGRTISGATVTDLAATGLVPVRGMLSLKLLNGPSSAIAACAAGAAKPCTDTAPPAGTSRMQIALPPLPPGTSTLTYPAQVGTSTGACRQLTNTASISDNLGTRRSNTDPVGVLSCGGALGLEKWFTTPSTPVGPQSSLSVNVGNGNAVLQAIDSTPVQAHGALTQVLRRTYNSQNTDAVSLPGSLGAGWTFNFGETGDAALSAAGSSLRLPAVGDALATARNPLGVVLVDRDGTRHQFTPRSLGAAISVDPAGSSAPKGSMLSLVPVALPTASVCLDVAYDAPKGVHLGLWRYVKVGTGGCGNVTTSKDPVVVGYATVRPDRMRAEYDDRGRLLAITDPGGVSLRYLYTPDVPLNGASRAAVLTAGRISATYEPRSCATSGGSQPNAAGQIPASCRAFRFDYGDAVPTLDDNPGNDDATPAVHVTDPARRVTDYEFDHDLGAAPTDPTAHLMAVRDVDGGSTTYTYGGCGGTADQLCTIKDRRGNLTRLGYANAGGDAAGSPQRLTTLTDRRGTRTDYDYTAGRTVARTANTKAQADADRPAPNEADSATPKTRTEYSGIDDDSRVHSVQDFDDSSGTELHRADMAWDSGCYQPLPAGKSERPDNNLCSLARRAEPAGNPGAGDESTEWLYNPEGMVLRQRQALAGATKLDTTYGYDTQYAGPSGPARVATDRVGPGGNVTSVGDRGGSDTLYAVSDRVQMLTPRGNNAGAAFPRYLSTMSVDADPSQPINAVTDGSCVADADGAVASRHNTGHVCQSAGPAPTAGADGSDTPSLTRASYDTFGQKATSTTAKAIAEAPAGQQPKSTIYRYYADPATPGEDVGAPKDITGTVRSGGWLRDTTDPEGHFVAFDYDRAGNVVRAWDRDATDGKNRDAYPAADVTSDRTADGAAPSGFVQTTYGPPGALAFSRPWRYALTVTDQLGHRTDTTVDGNGNPTRVRPPRGTAKGDDTFDVLASFDGGDLPLTTATPLQAAASTGTRLSYDAYGNRTSTVGPDTPGETKSRHTAVMRYDAVGRLLATRTSRDSTENTGGTPAGCASAGEGDGPLPAGRVYCTTRNGYDGVDNPVSATDGAGATSTANFDAVHRPTDVIIPRNADGLGTLHTHTDYDADSRPVRVCSPRQYTEGDSSCEDGSLYATITEYNPAGLPVAASRYRQAVQKLTARMSYDADGNRTASTDPRGTAADGTDVTVRSTFDLLGRQRTSVLPRTSGTDLTTTMVYSPSGDRIATAMPGEAGDNPGGPAARITATGFDAAHRPVDQLQALQVAALTTGAVQTAIDTALTDAGAQGNLRTRTVYDADDHPTGVYGPRAFTAGGTTGTAALLAAPDKTFLASTGFDADGRATSQLLPRADSSLSDPTGTGGDQAAQCRTGTDSYPADVRLCRTDVGYDLQGKPTSVALPTRTTPSDTSRQMTYAWTDDGLLRQVQAPDPAKDGDMVAVMTARFDGVGRPTSQANALGHTTSTDYTADGLVEKVSGPQGPNDLTHVTNYAYDAGGQQILVGTPRTTPGAASSQEPVTLTSYTADGLIAAVTAGRTRDQGRTGSTGQDLTTSYRYDGAGNSTEVLSPSGNAGQAPNAGRVPVRMSWTADRLLERTVEPVVVGAGGASVTRTTDYGYDNAGRKNAVGVTTTGGSSQDGQGAAGTQRFAYYPSDLLKAQYGRAADGNGPAIEHGYDADGNQTRLTDATSGRTVTGTFYADDLPRDTVAGGRRTGWSYDGAARPARRGEGPEAGSLAVTGYGRNDAGAVTSMTAPLDGPGPDGEASGTSSWTHNQLGQPLTGTRPDGSKQTWSWRSDDLLGATKVDGAGGGDDMLATWDYTYDELGRILDQNYQGKSAGPAGMADPGSGSGPMGAEPAPGTKVSYSSSYDTAGRLASFTDAKGKRTVTFDKDNNRTVYGSAGQPQPSSFTYRADGSVATSRSADPTGLAHDRTYRYAPFGGVTDDGCTSYRYDGFDRLNRTAATGQAAVPPEAGCAGMPSVDYTYDGLDRQISRAQSAVAGSPATTTGYDYDGWSSSLTRQQSTGAGGQTLGYTLGADGQTLTAARTGSPTEFLFDDGTGSTGLTTTRSRTGPPAGSGQANPSPSPLATPGTMPAAGDERVRCVSRYDAYGSPDGNTALPVAGACASGSAANDTYYRGNRRDTATGNYQLGSRTYDPTKAGFLTPDSYRTGGSTANASIGIDPLTRNTYAYVNGDPINLADPTGHEARVGADGRIYGCGRCSGEQRFTLDDAFRIRRAELLADVGARNRARSKQRGPLGNNFVPPSDLKAEQADNRNTMRLIGPEPGSSAVDELQKLGDFLLFDDAEACGAAADGQLSKGGAIACVSLGASFVGGAGKLPKFTKSGATVGFAADAVGDAFVGMNREGGHAIRHLVDKGLIADGGPLAARVARFEELATPILRSPSATFDTTLPGGLPAKGFLGEFQGMRVVIYIAKAGPYAGKVVTASVAAPGLLRGLGL